MPDNYLAKIAYPEFKKRRYRISKSKIYLENLSNNCSYIFESEQADVRQWRLLPAEIRVERILIPPGEYKGRIDFVDSNRAVVISKQIQNFTLKKREKKFFMFRTVN